jgi:opacity protein-like surface antigen
MRRGLFLFGVFFLAILVLSPQNSYSQEERLYSFNFKLGGYTPTGDLSDAKELFGEVYDRGPNLEISFAHKIIPHFGMEYSLGLLNTDIDESTVGSYKYSSDITAPYILATALGYYQFKIIELYGGGGLGYYFVNAGLEVKPPLGPQAEVEGDDSVFGAHLRAGLKFLITKTFYLGFEGRYIWTDEAKIQDESGFFQFDINGYTLFVVIGFRFD